MCEQVHWSLWMFLILECKRSGQRFAYFWRDNSKPCNICKCTDRLRTQCSEFTCPDQSLFARCPQVKYNYYCGCKVSCSKSNFLLVFLKFSEVSNSIILLFLGRFLFIYLFIYLFIKVLVAKWDVL